MPEGDLRGLGAGHPAADDEDLGRGRARHAAEQDPRSTGGALQVVRGGLDGHPAGDLAHGRQQRELAVGGLHGLVGDGVDAPLEQELGQAAVGGQVQVGEQLLAGPEAVVLRGHRLLDLHDQVGRVEHVVGGRHDLRAGGGVLVVGEPGPDTGAGLHDDLVAVVQQLHDTVRGERHPLLVVLDLARYSDDIDSLAHDGSPLLTDRCGRTRPVVGWFGRRPDQIRFSGFGERLAQDPLHLVDRTRRPR